MEARRKSLIKRTVAVAMLLAASGLIEIVFAPEAEAVFGTRRRTALVTAAVVHDQDQKEAAAQQQAQQPAPEPAATPAPAPAAAPAAGAAALPMGTVATALPSGCTNEAVEGVTYYRCGPDRYRAAFQGSQLVYVTVAP